MRRVIPLSISRRGTAKLLALPLVIALFATACGSDDDAAGSRAGSDTTTAASGDATDRGPVTIEHKYGSVEVPESPKRIVALDSQWADVLIALDAPPAAYLIDPNAPDGFPWRGDALADATGIEAVDSLPYEKIAALHPDLIVVSYLAQSEDDYDKLSAIAPTIATLSADQVDSWQDIATAAGKVLRNEDAAAALIAEVDDSVKAVGTQLPNLAGKTVVLANYVPGDGFYVVSDPKDGANVLFSQLGLEISPTILKAGEDQPARVKLSLEQSAMLDGDVLVLFTNGADPTDIPGYSDLPAVKSGAVAVLDYVAVAGLNTPSPLSVPYSLEQIRPMLEAAAA